MSGMTYRIRVACPGMDEAIARIESLRAATDALLRELRKLAEDPVTYGLRIERVPPEVVETVVDQVPADAAAGAAEDLRPSDQPDGGSPDHSPASGAGEDDRDS